MALLLHQSAGEDLCGTCTQAEALRRLSVEAIPTRPTPTWRMRPPTTVAEVLAVCPVTPDQAAQHCADLLAAVEPFPLRDVS